MPSTQLTTAEKTVMNTLTDILGDHSWCFYLASKQNVQKFSGLLPAIVIQHIPEEQVLAIPLGQHSVLTLGQNEDDAFNRIDALNAALGYSYSEVISICQSADIDIYVPPIEDKSVCHVG